MVEGRDRKEGRGLVLRGVRFFLVRYFLGLVMVIGCLSFEEIGRKWFVLFRGGCRLCFGDLVGLCGCGLGFVLVFIFWFFD